MEGCCRTAKQPLAGCFDREVFETYWKTATKWRIDSDGNEFDCKAAGDLRLISRLDLAHLSFGFVTS